MFEYELINILFSSEVLVYHSFARVISDNNDTHYVFIYQVDQIRQIDLS